MGSGPVALGPAKHWPRTLGDQFPGRWLLAFGRWIMAVKIDTLETVPATCGHRSGLGRKAIFLINGEFRAETTRCSKCHHLLHDGSVRLDFVTDDVNEAEEMRIQTLASDCVAEIRNSNESGWVAVRDGCWQTRW